MDIVLLLCHLKLMNPKSNNNEVAENVDTGNPHKWSRRHASRRLTTSCEVKILTRIIFKFTNVVMEQVDIEGKCKFYRGLRGCERKFIYHSSNTYKNIWAKVTIK